MPDTELAVSRSPSISAHRLLSNGCSSALVRPDGEIDWWCAPRFDSSPLLWKLLDPAGGCARWRGVRMVQASGPPAGPTVTTLLATDDGARVELMDGIVGDEHAAVLVRLVRAELPVVLEHDLTLGGFDLPAVAWTDAGEGRAGDLLVRAEGGELTVEGDRLRSTVTASTRWTGIAVRVGAAPGSIPSFAELAEDLLERERQHDRWLDRARLPRQHPGRARDALAVIKACTFEPSGAVIASPTTSLPEAPGHDRQFDYRFCWLRDAALSVSVAALLGDRQGAERYLDLACRTTDITDIGAVAPLFTVDGKGITTEREIDGVRGWGDSRPVRVGNAAGAQLQYDVLGMVLEAISVHAQTGGAMNRPRWELVRAIADHAVNDPEEESNGIWELRTPARLVSADIGRWLALDRAIWLARSWRPWTRRRHWKRARDEARSKVLGALTPEGRLPQTYDDPNRPDAVALLVAVFGMLDRRDERAHRIVDTVIADLAAGPFLYRYPPDGTDGFGGREGAFLPASFWLVSALAALGRTREACERLDDLCAALPALLSEEVDPGTGDGLGNTPLVWSHVELARALYILDAAQRRARWGPAGLWVWRLQRYARLRWGRR